MVCHLPTRTCLAPGQDLGADGLGQGTEAGPADGGLSRGVACQRGDQCASGQCVDGVCCAAAACGACQRCDLPGHAGTCHGVPDDTPCGVLGCTDGASSSQLSGPVCRQGRCVAGQISCGLYRCNPAGSACLQSCRGAAGCAGEAYCKDSRCKARRALGSACSDGDQCASGICQQRDRVCCDLACAGLCDTCTQAGAVGTCRFRPAGTPCGGAPQCVDAVGESYVRKEECSGKASFCSTVKVPCDPYRCAAKGATCKTACDGHDDCSTGLCDLFGVLGPKGQCPKAGSVCHADAARTCPRSGSGTVADPYCRIQDCLAAAGYVAVADGKYHENLSIQHDTQLVATGTSGALVKGGLPVAGVARVQLLPPAKATAGVAISGKVKVVLHGLDISHAKGSGASGALVSVATTGGSALLSSCHLHEGNDLWALSAAAATAARQQVTLRDVAVVGCAIGVDALDTDLTLEGCGVGGTTAFGLQQSGGKLVMRDTLVAANLGTGIQVYGSPVDLDRVRVSFNQVDGLRLEDDSSGQVSNLLASGNGKAGVVTLHNTSPPALINVTLAGNLWSDLVCPDAATGDPKTPVYNAIVGAASATKAYQGACQFRSCDVRGIAKPGVNGNLDQDPRFDTSDASDPFSLTNLSPCIDAGQDTIPGYTLPATDLLGHPRRVNRTGGANAVDMGAYEVQ